MGITERHSSSRASAQRASIGKRNRSSAVGAWAPFEKFEISGQ